MQVCTYSAMSITMQAPVSPLSLFPSFFEVFVSPVTTYNEVLCYQWFCRLFQEERPVWHIIDCNVLPKDHVGAKVRQENENTEIVMVPDLENSDLVRTLM